MRQLKKSLAMLLAVLMLIPLMCGIPVSAEEEHSGTDYATVFIHGLLGWGDEDLINSVVPYWGMTAGDMMSYLEGNGYKAAVASIGPISSAWDRCCELFAQLSGTRVDYGQAHSEKCSDQYEQLGYELEHQRYGRDYTGRPLIENWGPIYENGKLTGWYDNKVNLVGHSFGGPTSLEFLQLLAEGDEAERQWGKEQAKLHGGDWHDYVSPLFWGDYDGEYLVNSVTTLAGVLNGTTFISACDDETAFLTDMCVLLGNALGMTDIGALYDFQLEQFGLTKTPGSDMKAEFSKLKRSGFIDGDDQAWYDLSIAGCNELKQGWATYDNVYYFSYAGDKTYKDLFGNNVPKLDMWLPFQPFSSKIGSYVNRYEFVMNINGTRYGYIDDTWKPNDGMVNSIAARFPLGAAHKDYDENNIEAGIWNVYPDQDIDHLSFSGGLLNSKPLTVRKFYTNMMQDIAATTAIARPADAGQPTVPVEPSEPKHEVDPARVFEDVQRDDIFYDAVKWAINAEPQVCSGVSDGVFAPYGDCTRGQMVTFLWRASGCPEPAGSGAAFSDVGTSSPFYKAILWASENGITMGYGDGSFRPNDNVTRAQAASFLWRAVNCPKPAGTGGAFSDVAADAYYADAVLWANENGIACGYDDGSFHPNDTCKRWHIISFLYRYMEG